VKAPIGSPDLECFLKQLIGGRIAKTISWWQGIKQ
jgi:hypothetical protein